MRLTLVRHAQSEGNAAMRISGHHDHDLTDLGRQQAKAVGEALKDEHYDHVYVSDLTRTRDTAEAIIAHHPDTPVTYDPRFREKHFGIHENQLASEVSADVWDQPEDGETREQFRERITSFLDFLYENHQGEHVLLVTHGGVITALLMILADTEDHRQFPTSNASITLIEFDLERNHELHLQNVVDHLEDL